MSAESRTQRADRVISALAGRQHGVVARRQLLAAGVTRHQVARRVRNGRLHQLHRGVYLVGHTVPPPHAPEMAALLACGPHAVLSHRSAAVLWDLLPHQPSAHIAVTVPPRRGAERPLIAIHRFILERRDTAAATASH